MEKPILTVNNLKTRFFTRSGIVKAVDDISFELQKGECLCLVGESGCGKTVTVLSILGLLDSPPGRVVGGNAYYNDINLLECSREQMRHIRGKEIAMVFQDAQSALNPVFTIGNQITEQLKLHLGLSYNEARKKAVNLLEEIGIPSPEEAIDYYPHQLSGGMRQRAMIAMSLSCNPRILIADEPTTAVDVTIKAQILDILRQLKETRQMSLLFITHELGAVSEIGDRVLVMYAGKMMETTTVTELLTNPKHPYTVGLINCLPDMRQGQERLASIPGVVPSLINPPSGCVFHTRCPHVFDVCPDEIPPPFPLKEGHTVACHLYSHPKGKDRARPQVAGSK